MKEQNGITLVALVITIIVLLILAGVTIAALGGQNGILTNASKSQKETAISEAKEATAMAVNTILGNKAANSADGTQNNTPYELSLANLKTVIEANYSDITVDTPSASDTNTLKMKVGNYSKKITVTLDVSDGTDGYTAWKVTGATAAE